MLIRTLLLILLPLQVLSETYGPGTILKFGGGRGFRSQQYTIAGFLGQGGTTQVYALANDSTKAIRISPPNQEYYFDGAMMIPLRKYLTHFEKGQKKVKDAGIPIVNIYDKISGAYLVVDRVDGPTLAQFLLMPDKFSVQQRSKMMEDLRTFAKTTVYVEYIEDFKASSLLYDKTQGWLIIDLMGEVKKNPSLRELQSLTSRANIFGKMTLSETAADMLMDSSNLTPQQIHWADHVIHEVHGAIAEEKQRLKNCKRSIFSLINL